MEKIPSQEPLAFLDSEEKWGEAFKEAGKPFKSTLFLLNDKAWNTAVQKALRPEDLEQWESGERNAYLESLGRLAPGLEQLGFQGQSYWVRRLLGECRRLAEKLSSHREQGARLLLGLGAQMYATEVNTNSHGHSMPGYQKQLSAMARSLEASGDTAAAEALVNPFRLAAGTEIFATDEAVTTLTVKPVQDLLLENGEGLIVVDGEMHELQEFNQHLAQDDMMLKNGDNFFGGVEMLQKERVGPFQVGTTFSYRTDPFREDRESVKVVGSNQEEIEAAYGRAYLPFINRIKDTTLTVDVETSDGKVHRGIDIRQFRGVRAE